jgi:hypothetical protein
MQVKETHIGPEALLKRWRSAVLFLQIMHAKLKEPEKGGSRIAIILNHSPLSNRVSL